MSALQRRQTWWSLMLLAACAVAPALSASEDPVESREFVIEHASLADVAERLAVDLSDEGEVEVKVGRDRKLLLVTDRRSVLERIETRVAILDAPPRTLQVQLELFVAERRPPETGEAGKHAPRSDIYRDNRGVEEPVPRFTGFQVKETLGRCKLDGAAGQRLSCTLEGGYTVEFDVAAVNNRVVRLDGFRVRRGAQDLYKADMNLAAGTPMQVGAAQSPVAKRALFVTVKAQPGPAR